MFGVGCIANGVYGKTQSAFAKQMGVFDLSAAVIVIIIPIIIDHRYYRRNDYFLNNN